MGGSEWKLVKLGDVVSYKKGYAFKSSSYTNSGRLIVRVSDTTSDSIDTKFCMHLNDNNTLNYEDYKLQFNDVVIMTVGSWPNNPNSIVGKVVKVPREADNALLNQNAVRIRTNGKINSLYLFYILKDKDFSSYIVGTAQGSANQASITLSDIFSYKFDLPSLEKQKQIADILGSLDDKIELNNRINANLEAQAEALFKRWFVDFEFPDENGNPYKSAGGEFVESELGGIPWGWSVKTASEVFDISIGKTPPRKEPHWFSKVKENNINWVSISDMGNSGTYISQSREFLIRDAASKFNVTIVPDNTVILSFKLTVGRVAITDGLTTTNEAIAHFKTECSQLTEFIYLYLRQYNYALMGNTSSIATAVNSKIIKQMNLIIPSDEVLNDFSSILKPLFACLKNNLREIDKLSQLRDTLLPKLMNNEIKL